MIYPYRCDLCGTKVEIVKPMAESARTEECAECGLELIRIFTAPQIIGASVENAEFNPGLGCVVRNKAHREEIARQRGLIEVGNETPQTLHKESVIKRAEEREKEWDRIKLDDI